MTAADQYRALAADLFARARNESLAYVAYEWEHLALCYEAFAKQAESNGRKDTSREPILRG